MFFTRRGVANSIFSNLHIFSSRGRCAFLVILEIRQIFSHADIWLVRALRGFFSRGGIGAVWLPKLNFSRASPKCKNRQTVIFPMFSTTRVFHGGNWAAAGAPYFFFTGTGRRFVNFSKSTNCPSRGTGRRFVNFSKCTIFFSRGPMPQTCK